MAETGDELVGWELFDTYVRDDEVTADTGEAHLRGLALARRLWGDGFAHKTAGAALRILTPHGYLVEIRGQRAVTAHGMHGAHPGRIAALRELSARTGHPARMVFFEQSAATAWAVWLGTADEPKVERIAKDTARKRQGWWCRDLERMTLGHVVTDEAARLVFPATVPSLATPEEAGRLL